MGNYSHDRKIGKHVTLFANGIVNVKIIKIGNSLKLFNQKKYLTKNQI